MSERKTPVVETVQTIINKEITYGVFDLDDCFAEYGLEEFMSGKRAVVLTVSRQVIGKEGLANLISDLQEVHDFLED